MHTHVYIRRPLGRSCLSELERLHGLLVILENLKSYLGILGSLETQQLEILGFLRWMHAVVREHVELGARLDPWKLAASYAPDANQLLQHLYEIRGCGGKAVRP